MPQSLSAKKRVKQNEKHRIRNKSVKTAVRTSMKKLKGLAAAGDVEAARAAYPATVKKIDQATAKGVFHKNTASRYKSRLATLLNRASQ